ncbi:hypothetical protein GJ744_001956 [Endocarpon pusillum]|uniref:Uncharacterized protein n=1 Tax=Endocarpon pusillum TaxID=364733 RepID=A0A8H7A8N9_9EURO|nr:hypothetical protein GJ744_001956 [Endocarpon pusillum]
MRTKKVSPHAYLDHSLAPSQAGVLDWGGSTSAPMSTLPPASVQQWGSDFASTERIQFEHHFGDVREEERKRQRTKSRTPQRPDVWKSKGQGWMDGASTLGLDLDVMDMQRR